MRETPPTEKLADRIDSLLPQTQCRKCGYAGCRPYAEALAAGAADIDLCPPGGDACIRELADLLGIPAKPLNAKFGGSPAAAVIVIDEPACIGCTLCIQACPVDAIVGSAGTMHTVIAGECTGCELCVPACPVDCMVLEPAPVAADTDRRTAAERARRRFHARTQRLERVRRAKTARTAPPRESPPGQKKRAAITRAVERAKAKLARARP
jgi:electron transport complex protein RnfB